MYDVIQKDRVRYSTGRMPCFQWLFRKAQCARGLGSLFYQILYRLVARSAHIEIPTRCQIGPGLYIVHPYCITINSQAVLGANCNLHKGVTIGQTNRGDRKGTPVIGNRVWIGVNATVVGKITIGDDVLIAPNTYVNQDIPAHSVVFGNPCIIKHRENATEQYINRRVDMEELCE